MVVTRKCKDPAYKPPPHFCPILACTKGGGVIAGFYGNILITIDYVIDVDNEECDSDECLVNSWRGMKTVIMGLDVMVVMDGSIQSVLEQQQKKSKWYCSKCFNN